MVTNFYSKPFPVLNLDDQYYLREQSLEDTEAFFEYYTTPIVGKYILATIPTTLSSASSEIHHCRNLFYQKGGICWTIARKEDNRMIGAVGLYINNQHHRAEICYDLHEAFWRRGIMSKAIEHVTAFAFQHTEIHRIEAVTLKENLGSIGVLEKQGYIHEATLHNYRYFKNKVHDVELLAITPQQLIQYLNQDQELVEVIKAVS